jgi:hypothetical protein
MKKVKLLFPFAGKYGDLKERWWHRLFFVIFVLIMIGGALLSFYGWFSEFPKAKYNLKLGQSLDTYTRTTETDGNTIGGFVKQKGAIGCLKDNNLNTMGSYTLETYGYCNINLKSKEDLWIEHMMAADYTKTYTKESLKEDLKKNPGFYNDNNGRVCVLATSFIDCNSTNIIHYNPNILYYLEALFACIITIYISCLLLQVVYFGIFIYIVKGKPKKSPNE